MDQQARIRDRGAASIVSLQLRRAVTCATVAIFHPAGGNYASKCARCVRIGVENCVSGRLADETTKV